MLLEIFSCILCGKRGRLVASKYTKICTIQYEEKIREGYRRRHGEELNGLSRRVKHYSNQVSIPHSVLANITSNESTTPLGVSYYRTSTNESFNTSFIFENQERDANKVAPIEIYFDDDKEVR
ncbi:unnamed protein product [Rotaria magnacalcarata]|uniref:Uncharacterized protein n=1 Tax=Rotaria magnacalcarata TaxID=392030 RepID=A0A816MSG4_9BILA|nr:unnamed protein product [Rotaria magnacalcarata]